MDFSQFKKLTVGGTALKQLFIGGVQVWQEPPSIINQIPISTDASGAVYNGKGFKENTWVNGGNENYNWGTFATGFIPCKPGDVIRMQDMSFTSSVSHCRMAFYKSDKSYVGQAMANSSWYMDTEFKGVKDSSGNYVQLTIKAISGISANCAFIRITAASITANSILTINQEIA